LDLHKVDSILEKRGAEPFDVMEAMQDLQELHGYLPEWVLRRVSEKLEVPPIEAFSLQPRGSHLLTVCTGTACHVRGAPRMLDEVVAELQIGPGETTADRAFTVETVNCLGACALSPVVVIDGTYHDNMTPTKLRTVLEAVRAQDRELAANV
jgi:NADH-quinone oxidoreductase subunit E